MSVADRVANGGEYRYRPAWWLPGGHAQTLWGKFGRRTRAPATVVERLPMPDGDAIELHTVDAPRAANRLLLLHGLEGSVRSHYARGILSAAAARGWGATLLVFRGCGATPNTARRFYHSGETTDLSHVMRVVRDRWPDAAWHALGVSLGGNVLLKWLGETGAGAGLRAAAAVSVPFDLEAGARCITHGFARVYDRSFVRSLRAKALAKLVAYPDLFDRDRLLRARTVFDFDEAVTAPVHGFADAHDYYSRSSAEGFLNAIRIPTLLLSAADDPFLPRPVLERVAGIARKNRFLATEFQSTGGHVGFVTGPLPWRAGYYAEQRAFAFFEHGVAAARATH